MLQQSLSQQSRATVLPHQSQSRTLCGTRYSRRREASCRAVSRRELLGASITTTLSGCGCPACAFASQSKPMHQDASMYQKYFAYAMATSMGEYERAVQPWKEALFATLVHGQPTQRVLELGVGTGPNFKYLAAAQRQQHQAMDSCHLNSTCCLALNAGDYKDGDPRESQSLNVVGLDPNNAMQAYAKQVLCSVQDPVRAVSEVLRVLRPGGRLLFIEHVAASWDKEPIVRAEQALLNPLQVVLADNCHLTRNTQDVLERAKFSELLLISESLPGVGSLLSPHIRGIAVK